MANIIALIWDFDKTLISGYMQEPIFKHYGIDEKAFWDEVTALPEKYLREQGVTVNADTIYLNHFIHLARDGKMKGLNNAKLAELGGVLPFYKGVPEIFQAVEERINSNPSFRQYGIMVEHYVVSTGFAAMIRGSQIMPYIKKVWGCELIEATDAQGENVISEIGYTIDNTTKTRAIFEINKGIPFVEGITVNSTMPEAHRRVHFQNMIYIADGPSDIPAFSLVRKGGGSTFAVYPSGDFRAMQQVERMRRDGRVDMYAEADYSEGTTAYMWIMGRVLDIAERIAREELERIKSASSEAPEHLH